MCEAIIALHAHLGCDAVLAFTGRGKVQAFKLTSANEEWQDVYNGSF